MPLFTIIVLAIRLYICPIGNECIIDKVKMVNKKNDSVDLLLSKFDREQLVSFIKKECAYDRQFQDRFLALGAGTLFKPSPASYTARVKKLIDKYSGRHGFVEYNVAFDFNRDVMCILDEADEAISNRQWEVAVAALTGVTAAADDVINCGDDSDGELGDIVCSCFEKWHELCSNDALPGRVKSDIFELALQRFKERHLEGWSWWWDWIEMSIELSDTPERQGCVIKALDAIKPDGDDWSARHYAQKAQEYKLEIMSRNRTVEE